MGKEIAFDSQIKIGIRYDGNRITKVSPGCQAETAGVKVGWTVESINGIFMPSDTQTVKNAIKQAKSQTTPLSIVFTMEITSDHTSDTKMAEERNEARKDAGVILISVYRIEDDEKDVTGYRLAEVSDLTRFNKMARKTIRGTLRFGARVICERAKEGQTTKVTMPDMEDFSCYVCKKDNGLSCVICVDEAYPRNTAQVLVDKTLTGYEETYPNWKKNKLQDSSTQPNFMKKDLKDFQDPQSMDKVYKCLVQVAELKDIAEQNLDDMLAKGEKLDDLIDVADELSAGSKMFLKKAKEENRRCPKGCVIL